VLAVLTDKSLLTYQTFVNVLRSLHLAPLKKVDGLDTEFLAKQTQASGADIANVCNEAALIAATTKRPLTNKTSDAVDRIVGGLEEKQNCDSGEKKAIAIHEAGHATVSWMLEHAAPL
jgi:cell division protease FtsH